MSVSATPQGDFHRMAHKPMAAFRVKHLAEHAACRPSLILSMCARLSIRCSVKDSTDASFSLVVDEEDAMREELGIEKDLFGLLGGRETYVLDASGTVVSVHNSQFDPESHVKVALAAVESLPKSPIEEILDQIKEAVDGLQSAIPK